MIAEIAMPAAMASIPSTAFSGNRLNIRGRDSPSPLAGEGGDPRSGEGEGFAARSETRRHAPHLPTAAPQVPSSPATGEENLLSASTDPPATPESLTSA